MLYVVDASVAVKWFIHEPHRDKAMTLLLGFRNKRLELRAPDHIVAEVASALWKLSALRNQITASEAEGSHADFLALKLKLHPVPSIIGAALRLAVQEHHTPYDMFYVALAAQLGCQFITADERLAHKLGGRFPFILWLGHL